MNGLNDFRAQQALQFGFNTQPYSAFLTKIPFGWIPAACQEAQHSLLGSSCLLLPGRPSDMRWQFLHFDKWPMLSQPLLFTPLPKYCCAAFFLWKLSRCTNKQVKQIKKCQVASILCPQLETWMTKPQLRVFLHNPFKNEFARAYANIYPLSGSEHISRLLHKERDCFTPFPEEVPAIHQGSSN